MRYLPAPAAQISRVEFPALLTGSANRSRRRCGPDRPPCCGARRQNRSSWVSTENTRKAKPCAAMEAKRQVVARPSLLYRLGHRRLPQYWPRGGVVTQRTANPCTPVRFRPWPPILSANGVGHFVSHFVAFVHALPRSSFVISANPLLFVRAGYLW